MGDYVLISFYNRGTMQNPLWEVYGHKTAYDNDLLNDFHIRDYITALQYAHSQVWSAPVIQGSGVLIRQIVRKLVGGEA